MSATDRQTTKALHLATKAAMRKLGAAWDTMPCLRDGAVAVELLAIIGAKDPDATSAPDIIAIADAFSIQAAN